ncbi:integrase core domain-containing protein [Thalassovivens spotae]
MLACTQFKTRALQRANITKQAQVAINAWLRQYNQIRPHHALNRKPPVPETLLEKTKISGTETWG